MQGRALMDTSLLVPHFAFSVTELDSGDRKLLQIFTVIYSQLAVRERSV